MAKKQDCIKNKVVAITGGARGIGLATAKLLASRGGKVSIGDVDEEQAALEAKHLGLHSCHLDVRNKESFHSFISSTEAALGPIDILINNAGIMPMGAFTEEEDAISDTQIDINLRGVIIGMKQVLPGMQMRNSGHIVNIASLAGCIPIPGAAIYSATKFAVVGLTDCVREENREYNIDFSTVMPSKVLTDLTSGTEGAKIPSVTPEEVAEAILDSISKKLINVTVPRYLAPTPGIYNIAPHWLMKPVRRLLNDTQLLKQLNASKRAAYSEKLQQLSINKLRR